MMSATRKNHFITTLLAALTVLVGMVTAAAAQDKPSRVNSWQTAKVIAHLPMKGGPVSEMFLETQNRKQYLFLSQLSKQDYTVIDVSKPEHPSIVDNLKWFNADNSERVRMVGSGLALDETPESAGTGSVRHELVPAKNQPATTAIPPTESVRLLDLSDPKNPRTLQTFQGVTSVLADDGRSLIYIANNEGLWILRHWQYQQMPLCDSESVFSPIADCQ